MNKIQTDLTEEETAELEARKTKAIEKMSAQKQAFEKALEEAEKTAKNYLSERKEARKKTAD